MSWGDWAVKGVEVTSNRTAIIRIFIPGVNQRDRVDVELNLIDRLIGVNILDKTESIAKKWANICRQKNAERKRAHELTAEVMSRIKSGGRKE